MPVKRDGFEPLLDLLTANSARYFGEATAAIEPVLRIERPFSSLLRLRIGTGARSFHAFLKVFKPRRSTAEELAQLRRWVLREYDATARLHEAFAALPGLSAVRPIAVFPDRLALVTEEAAGLPFDRVLRDGLWGRRIPAPLADTAARVGAWIRTYQEVTPGPGVLSLAERREYLDERLRAVSLAAVITETDRATALARFDQLAGLVGEADLRLVAIHADLCPANVLVAPDGSVTILDFAMAKTGSRLHDLAHFYMHLEFQRWRPRPRSSAIGEVERALLEGFESVAIGSHPLFRLMLLQHVVCHIAQLTQHTSGPLQPAQRWLARRRWRRCARMPGVELGTGVAAG